jgi:hypothetical protein
MVLSKSLFYKALRTRAKKIVDANPQSIKGSTLQPLPESDYFKIINLILKSWDQPGTREDLDTTSFEGIVLNWYVSKIEPAKKKGGGSTDCPRWWCANCILGSILSDNKKNKKPEMEKKMIPSSSSGQSNPYLQSRGIFD